MSKMKNKKELKLDITWSQLDENDLVSFRDVIFNAFDKEDVSTEQLKEYWNNLPEDLRLDAIKYGVSDTPTREKMHLFFKK